MRVVDQLAECGVYQVGKTGGEPLIPYILHSNSTVNVLSPEALARDGVEGHVAQPLVLLFELYDDVHRAYEDK